MVGVRPVIIGRQQRTEQPTRPIAHRVQESSFRTAIVPVGAQRDARPVSKDEGRNVDRIGGRMFALRLPSGDLSAFLAAQIFKADNLLSEMILRRGLNHIARP